MAPSPSSLPPEVWHARQLFFAAALQLLRHAVQVMGDIATVTRSFPFVAAYTNEAADAGGMAGMPVDAAPAHWQQQVQDWELTQTASLPMRNLSRRAALDWADQVLLAGVDMVEQDLRFGALFEALHGSQGELRPSAGLLASWEGDGDDHATGLARVRRLVRLGLLEVINPGAPLPAWSLRLPEGLGALLRGEGAVALPPGLRWHAVATLPTMESLLFDAETLAQAERLPAMLQAQPPCLLVLRGFARNGRRTLAGAVARQAGWGVLEVAAAAWHERAAPPQIGALAATLDALPVLLADPGPGSRVELPGTLWPDAPAVLTIGRSGGVAVPSNVRCIGLDLPLPGPDVARRLWDRALPEAGSRRRQRLAAELRMASGAVIEIGTLARAQAQLAGHASPRPRDLRLAARLLGREALDTLATRAPDLHGAGSGSQRRRRTLVVDESTQAELQVLEQRCRCRQGLGAGVSPALAGRLTPGVRALFRGPSGTGKSLCARVLADLLGKDLYTCNLATVVSKYIGETEKHLAQLLDAAEAMDVVLAIEEADSLFARRSETVNGATDRYANMETNFLLQRLESFGGILLLTTNLFDAIDTAFLRRFDAIVDFRLPGPLQRLRLLNEHLPPGHQVTTALLTEIAQRCELSGGQLRNVVVDAALQARAMPGSLGDFQLSRAVRREFQRTGAVCMLRGTV